MTASEQWTGDDVRELQDLLDLTNERFAKRLGVSERTISNWKACRDTVVDSAVARRRLSECYAQLSEAAQARFPRRLAQQPGTASQAASPSGSSRLALTPAEASGTADDPRVVRSQQEWRQTRAALNANRLPLTHLAGRLYDPQYRLADTGLLTHPNWLPTRPIDLAAIDLAYDQTVAPATLEGNESESDHVRPQQSLVRRYQRYTHAIRDLAQPRLFENRLSWRLTELEWIGNRGRMTYGPTTYFEAVDIYEMLAHETAYVHLDEDGAPRPDDPSWQRLPFRRLIRDPFDLRRRPLLPSISTLTIRLGNTVPQFLLHRRDPNSVAVAGGMLQVIPSGVFQPSSVLPGALNDDFDLWRNIMREYSEELLGHPEYNGDGQPVDYEHNEPFVSLDAARRDGRIRVYCLGLALDALTLVGEILTVAVFESKTFDQLAGDFVDLNDEGSIVTGLQPFTQETINGLIKHREIAPAGAGCLHLAWQNRRLLCSGRDNLHRIHSAESAGLSASNTTRTTWSPPPPSTLPVASASRGASDLPRRISQRIISLSKTLRLPEQDTRQLAALVGNIVDLDLRIDLTIAKDGSSIVSYRHELFNMTDRTFTRLSRELWFVHTTGPLDIQPIHEGRHRVVIQRAATTPNLAKFACQISPALEPGDSAIVAYSCHGGKFVDEWYWREAIRRHTRHTTIAIRLCDANKLVDCSTTVEYPDGSERSGAEGLLWDNDRDDLVITSTNDHLNPNQTVTVRWDVRNESA